MTTQKCKVAPYFYAVYWLHSQFRVLIGQKTITGKFVRPWKNLGGHQTIRIADVIG